MLNKYIMAKKESSILNFNEHLTGRYGARGSERRTEFEIKAKAFLIGELIKDGTKTLEINFVRFGLKSIGILEYQVYKINS